MTSPRQERLKVPLAIAAVILALAISFFAWWLWYVNQLDACAAEVAARRDDRAMWEYLVDTRGVPDSPETKAFIAHMDERLPRLRCEGTKLVTIPPEEE